LFARFFALLFLARADEEDAIQSKTWVGARMRQTLCFRLLTRLLRNLQSMHKHIVHVEITRPGKQLD
jgi:hypothetical protein